MPVHIPGHLRDYDVAVLVDDLEADGSPTNIDAYEHSHGFTELSIIHGGCGIHRVNGEDYSITAGSVFVVQGNQTHCYPERHDLRLVHVKYDPDAMGLPLERLRQIAGYKALFELEPSRRELSRYESHFRLRDKPLAHSVRLARALRQEVLERPSGFEAMVHAHMVELLVLLAREYSLNSPAEHGSLLRVARLVSLLEQEYARKWRLGELCERANMSKSTLCRLFKEATGHTPIDFLVHVRLRRAMEMLRETDWTVTRIASATGFSDSNYLARKFGEVVGSTPTQYRKENSR